MAEAEFADEKQWAALDLEVRTKRAVQLLKKGESRDDEISRILDVEIKHKQSLLPYLVKQIAELSKSSNPETPEGKAAMLSCFAVTGKICRASLACDDDIQIPGTTLSQSLRNKLLTNVIGAVRQRKMPNEIKAAAYTSLNPLLSLAEVNIGQDAEREIIIQAILAGLKDDNVKVLKACLSCAVVLAQNTFSRSKLPTYLAVPNAAGKYTTGSLAAAIQRWISHDDQSVSYAAMFFWSELLRRESDVFGKVFQAPICYGKVLVPIVVESLRRQAKKKLDAKPKAEKQIPEKPKAEKQIPEKPKAEKPIAEKENGILASQDLLELIFEALPLRRVGEFVNPIVKIAFPGAGRKPAKASTSEIYVALSVMSAYAKTSSIRGPLMEKDIPIKPEAIISVLGEMADQELVREMCFETLIGYTSHSLPEKSLVQIHAAFEKIFKASAGSSADDLKISVLAGFNETFQIERVLPPVYLDKYLALLETFFSEFQKQVMTLCSRDRETETGLTLRYTAATVIGEFFTLLQHLTKKQKKKAKSILQGYLNYAQKTLPSVTAAVKDKNISLKAHQCVCIHLTTTLMATEILEVAVDSLDEMGKYASALSTRAVEVHLTGDDKNPDFAEAATTGYLALELLHILCGSGLSPVKESEDICFRILASKAAPTAPTDLMLQRAVGIVPYTGAPYAEQMRQLLGMCGTKDLATTFHESNEEKFITVRDSLGALSDLVLDAEPPGLALHTREIIDCLLGFQDQVERTAALITAKEYAKKIESNTTRVEHVTKFLKLCNDLAETYCTLLQTAKLEKVEATALPCRLINTVCTFIQIGQVQQNASTFEEAGQVLIICGNLIGDLLKHVGFENFPKEAQGAARTIMNILVTTPVLQDQIEAKEAVEFCRAFWKETY